MSKNWDKESCRVEALKYKTLKEFYTECQSAYRSAIKLDILNEITSHLKSNGYTYWNKDMCIEEANKYDRRSIFFKNSQYVFKYAKENGFLEEICSHMDKHKIVWTIELCHIEAKKYNTRTEFQKNNSIVYRHAFKNEWLKSICSHMLEKKKPSGYWTYDKCLEEAKKYNTRSLFKKGGKSAYQISLKNGWLNEIYLFINL
jgi:hypothetical protein